MTLTEYIDQIKLENNIQHDTAKIAKYIVSKARKQPKDNGCAAVDNETVKKWILEYSPDKDEKKDEKKVKVEDKVKTIPTGTPVGKEEEKENEWGVQESLF